MVRSLDNKIRITGIGGWEPHGRLEVDLCDEPNVFHQEIVLHDGQWQGQPWLDASMKAAILERIGWKRKDWPDVQPKIGGLRGLLKRGLAGILGEKRE